MPEAATDWSGATSTTLKTAMSTLAADMRQSAPHFATVVTAVSTFRAAAETALADVAGLNTAWDAAVRTHADDVAKAAAAYDTAKQGTPSGVWKAEEPDLARTRASATAQAGSVLATSQRWIGASYVAVSAPPTSPSSRI